MSRAKTEYIWLNGTSLGNVLMQSAQLPQVTELKYLGSTRQSDGDMYTEENKRTRCGWNNWNKMPGILFDKRVPSRMKGKIHNVIVQPAILYRMETVPMTSSHVKKLEVTDMKLCRWTCSHTLRDHVRNDDTRERLSREHHRDVQESKLEVVWKRQEARPRLRRKKDSGDGTTLGEECEEDRSRNGWTVSTGT